MRSPRLVAESLRVVPEAIDTVLAPVRVGDATTMSRIVAAAREPARHRATPPGFLRPHQLDPWQRTMAALAGWSAAVLAEPVGVGKTWIALGVAASWRRRCVVVGPAALAQQWCDAMRRAGITAPYHTLERVSRGVTPPAASLVIIDEAHRLRHLGTRRVAVLAPWLVGRRCVFLTATPIVNRRRDLLDLLSLIVPDDALALDGIASLRALERCAVPPPGLQRLVIRSARSGSAHPATTRFLGTSHGERRRVERVMRGVDSLRLADEPGVRRLIATVLLDAGASSDAAWHAALRRYRALLLHSRDAGGLARSALRTFVAAAPDQLVFWPLLAGLDRGVVLPGADLGAVEAMLAIPAADQGWLAPMARLLADGRVTTCFCRHRATAGALATALGDGVAWVTGQSAGIGPHRLQRGPLLAAFGPDRSAWHCRRQPPTVLVATEVLAEGLDLQAASRVVHVDLPWHATRIEQRTGRVRRAGQQAPSVDVVHRCMVGTIERRLGMRRRIRRKGRIAGTWLVALAAAPPAETVETVETRATWLGIARGESGPEARVWVALEAGNRRGCLEIVLGHTGAAVPRRGDPAWQRATDVTAADVDTAIPVARRAARWALAQATEPRRVPRHAALIGRILGLARTAAARRDHRALIHLDRLLAVATTPVPRGVDLALAGLERADDEVLLRAACPAPAPIPPVTVRFVALALYRRPASPLP